MRGSILHFRQDTPATRLKTLGVAAWSLKSTATEESSQRQNTEVDLSRQVPPLLELAAQGLASTVLVTTRETRDESSTCQGAAVCTLESQFSPKFYKGRKTSAAVYAECPLISSFGYSAIPNPQL